MSTAPAISPQDPSEGPAIEGAAPVSLDPSLQKNDAEPTTAQSSRKRKIQEVEEAERLDTDEQQNPIIEHNPNATDGASQNNMNGTDAEHSSNISNSENHFANKDITLADNNTNDSHPEHSTTQDGNGVVNQNGSSSQLNAPDPSNKNVAVVQSIRPPDRIPAPSEIPATWADAHEADRTLFKARNERRDWLEVCDIWERVSGSKVGPTILANRYARLRAETRDSLKHEDLTFIAAVQEVMTDLQRQSWQLVSAAMARRNASGLSADSCKQRYETLLRIAPNATARIAQKELQIPVLCVQTQSSDIKIATALDRAIDQFGRGRTTDELGSASSNAVVVGDSGSNTGSANVPVSRTHSSTVTAPRVGIATDWGPDRFLSDSQASNNTAEKSAKITDATTQPLPFQGFGMLRKTDPQINNASLQYNAHHAPGPLVERMAKQQGENQPLAQQTNYPPNPSRVHISPYHQPPYPQASIPYGLPVQQGATGKAFGLQTPTGSQAAKQPQFSQQEHSAQSTEANSHVGSSPFPATDEPTAKKSKGGRPKKAITKENLSRMVKYKNLTEATRSKPWDIITRDLGVTATVSEISKALTEAGIGHSQNDFSVSRLSEGRPVGFSSTATQSTALSSVNDQPGAVLTPSTSARAPEIPVPTETAQIEDTPSTQRRRGRPRKYQSETPTAQTPTSSGRAKNPAQRAKMSEAMKAAWARRKAQTTNGSTGSPAQTSFNRSSAAAFAAQVLAAAAAQENTPPSSEPRAESNRNNNGQDDLPRDLLNGKTMYEQEEDEDDTPAAQDTESPRPKKKIRGPYKKKDKSVSSETPAALPPPPPTLFTLGGQPISQMYSLPISGPATTTTPQPAAPNQIVFPSSSKDSPRHICSKCGKSYGQMSGLKWHQVHHPDCETAPKRRDKRTDAPGLGNASWSNPSPAPTAQMQSNSSSSAPPAHGFGISLPTDWTSKLFET